MNNNGKGVQATSLNEYTQRNHKGCFYTAKARPRFALCDVNPFPQSSFLTKEHIQMSQRYRFFRLLVCLFPPRPRPFSSKGQQRKNYIEKN